MQALERMMRRIVTDALEPLTSRMDRIDGGGSHSVHDEAHGDNEVEQSLRQHTPRQGHLQQVDDNLTNINVDVSTRTSHKI
ncbi:hypothetical protein V6N13_034112 [Hibiscus sabdariffa]